MTTDLTAYTEANKAALDSMTALGEINYNTGTRLLQQQVDLVNLYFEAGVKQFQLFSEAGDLKTLLTEQADLSEEVGKRLLFNLQGSLEVLEGAKAQWSDWNEASLAKLQQSA